MKRFLTMIILLMVSAPLSQPEEQTSNYPPDKYKKWLEEEIVYIISPTERKVFLELETDKERELFIEAFWKHRDPISGTPENEFKQEHYRRIQYANEFFGRRAPKPGWKTDQGQIYILLGEPQNIERITGDTQVYNTEIWFYQGLKKYGLPDGFNLVFYQKGGVGEYVLYSPTQDGPQAFMTSYFGDHTNHQEAFRQLRKINPELAKVSVSLIPGESVYYGQPSLSAVMLLQNVYSLPQRQFDDIYAEKFLLYKDIVEVDYTANYIDSDALFKVIKHPSGIYFVHYVIELMRFSVQMIQDRYVTNLKINGSVIDAKGKTIFQYEGTVPFEFDESRLKAITFSPFDFYDMFPLLPGEYRLTVLLKNESSKEFTSAEGHITIPDDESSLGMGPLFLGYKKETFDSSNLRPFWLGRDRIFCQPRAIFHPQDTLHLHFQVLSIDADLLRNGALCYEFFKESEQVLSFMKKIFDYDERLNIGEEVSLKGFLPGHYRVEVTLLQGGQKVQSHSQHFEVTSSAGIVRPWVYAKTSFPVSHPAFAYVLGMQHFNKGEIQQARSFLERAYLSQLDSLEYALSLSRVYLMESEYEKVKETLLPFSRQPEPKYDVWLLLAKANHAKGEIAAAVSFYEKTISHFGVNTLLLNSLGDCYARLGRTEDARLAWTKSLELNPDQPQIKEKIKPK